MPQGNGDTAAGQQIIHGWKPWRKYLPPQPLTLTENRWATSIQSRDASWTSGNTWQGARRTINRSQTSLATPNNNTPSMAPEPLEVPTRLVRERRPPFYLKDYIRRSSLYLQFVYIDVSPVILCDFFDLRRDLKWFSQQWRISNNQEGSCNNIFRFLSFYSRTMNFQDKGDVTVNIDYLSSDIVMQSVTRRVTNALRFQVWFGVHSSSRVPFLSPSRARRALARPNSLFPF